MDVEELHPGLWRWTAQHPEWDLQWVSCAYVELPALTVLVDPLVPHDEEERFYAALDRDVERRGTPVEIALTNPWHRRSADELAARYDAEISTPLAAYPGGMQPEDFVLHSPEHAALFTGDTIVDGELAPEDWLAEGREHQLACLRALLPLGAELVVTSHGSPLSAAQFAALLDSPRDD